MKKSLYDYLNENNVKTPSGNSVISCYSIKNLENIKNISYGSATLRIIDCDICDHEFLKSPNKLTNQFSWCPYCTTNNMNKKLCSDNCKECYNNSFASYDGLTTLCKKKVDCWSRKNKKTPREVFISASRKTMYYFDCDKCPHDFKMDINHITTRDSWCPYCYTQICEKEDCSYCYNKSFASYDGLTTLGKKKVECWSKINKLKPRDVPMQSNIKKWFKCDVCPHEFDSTLGNISNGNWCPYCAITVKQLCEEDCNHCYNKSFASYDGLTTLGKKKVECWSYKNKSNPRDFSICSGKKFICECDKCSHEWMVAISKIVNDNWCPKCNESKGEKDICNILTKLNYKDNGQIKFNDCKDKNKLPFDNGIIDELPVDVLIEYDGQQHFNNIEFFGGKTAYKKRIKHDILKNKYCLENNKILIRIAYTDINKIEDLIREAIELSKNRKSTIIYSNPSLYQTSYFPTWKSHVVNKTIYNLVKLKHIC